MSLYVFIIGLSSLLNCHVFYCDVSDAFNEFSESIELVQEMYEKGFSALERSHQRSVVEMRRAHRQELEDVRQEMHRLLSEEADATQAGLVSANCLFYANISGKGRKPLICR